MEGQEEMACLYIVNQSSVKTIVFKLWLPPDIIMIGSDEQISLTCCWSLQVDDGVVEFVKLVQY